MWYEHLDIGDVVRIESGGDPALPVGSDPFVIPGRQQALGG